MSTTIIFMVGLAVTALVAAYIAIVVRMVLSESRE
jgi:hypothetical protein